MNKVLIGLMLILLCTQVASVLYIRKKFNDSYVILKAYDDGLEERIIERLSAKK